MTFTDIIVVLGIVGAFAAFVTNRLTTKYPKLKESLSPYLSNPINRLPKSMGTGIEKRQQVWHEDRNIM